METLDYWKISKKWPKRILFSSVILLVSYILISPFYCDYIDRAKVNAMAASVNYIKLEISEIIESGRPLSEINTIKLKDYIGSTSFVFVSGEGHIFTYSEDVSTFLLFTPTIIDNKVIWRCVGQPEINIPRSCDAVL
ncbi:MAG: hypothetical protein HRU38_02075 [Saccharospirillaceae bacterium]|nr:hypothetical protein [Pseudomonadales bacterium]NRB77447.1 hypothetical protein [Saccharospirillaceae bacterium]